MSPALLVGIGCFLGTLGVATFAWLMADTANRKDSARQWDYERRLRRRLARSTEDRDYLLLHGRAADVLNGPYDQQRPLGFALGEKAGEIGASDTGRTAKTPSRVLVVPAFSPSSELEAS